MMDVRSRAEDVPTNARREYWQHVFETVFSAEQVRPRREGSDVSYGVGDEAAFG